MSGDDDILLALIGMGAWRAAAAARRNAEYQRQQLNLLRRHQGLPPIPPDPPDHTWANFWLLMGWSLSLCLGIAAGVALHAGTGVAWQGWLVGTSVTWWLGGQVRRLYARHVHRREADFYAAWHRAGCP